VDLCLWGCDEGCENREAMSLFSLLNSDSASSVSTPSSAAESTLELLDIGSVGKLARLSVEATERVFGEEGVEARQDSRVRGTGDCGRA